MKNQLFLAQGPWQPLSFIQAGRRDETYLPTLSKKNKAK
jgi:hypothetical protein